MAQKVFSFAISIDLLFRVNGHDILYEIQIPERHPGFQRMYRNAAVCPQNIIHMQFMQTFLRFFLERIRVGRIICIFISKEFIGNLTSQQYANICIFMDGFADQIHAHAGTNCCNIKGT